MLGESGLSVFIKTGKRGIEAGFAILLAIRQIECIYNSN